MDSKKHKGIVVCSASRIYRPSYVGRASRPCLCLSSFFIVPTIYSTYCTKHEYAYESIYSIISRPGSGPGHAMQAGEKRDSIGTMLQPR